MAAAGGAGSSAKASGPSRPFDNGNPYDLGTFQGMYVCIAPGCGGYSVCVSRRGLKSKAAAGPQAIDRKSQLEGVVNSHTHTTHLHTPDLRPPPRTIQTIPTRPRPALSHGARPAHAPHADIRDGAVRARDRRVEARRAARRPGALGLPPRAGRGPPPHAAHGHPGALSAFSVHTREHPNMLWHAERVLARESLEHLSSFRVCPVFPISHLLAPPISAQKHNREPCCFGNGKRELRLEERSLLDSPNPLPDLPTSPLNLPHTGSTSPTTRPSTTTTARAGRWT